jgi:hypothetical protein
MDNRVMSYPDLPRLELGAHILRNSGQNVISVTLKQAYFVLK